jgi:hypothetical protein
MAGLATLGKVAGIAGIALGVMLLVFRDVAAKLARKLRPRDAPKLLRLIVIATWTTGVVGVGVWALGAGSGCSPTNLQTAGSSSPIVACADGPVRIDVNQGAPALRP